MTIHGFQKTTLLDFPGKVAATVFTAGCNLRCPFCHNALLVTEIDPQSALDSEELLAYFDKRRGILDGVCVSGGEPLLQPDVFDFMRRIRDMGLAIKLDTNGAYPDRLCQAVEEGLVDYVAMDIKNSRAKYPLTVGIPTFDVRPIEESVAYLMSDAVDYEFRTTVVAEFHTLQDMEEIGGWIAGAKRYFLQNFVDSDHLIDPNVHGVDESSMKALQRIASKYVKKVELRGI